MPYLLDANVFIQAKNFHYGFDFCPAFWEWLDTANKNGMLFSIEKVGEELKAGADELATWATSRGPEFFLPLDGAILPALGHVSNWVTGQQYDAAAVNTFLQVADYYLVAHAFAHRKDHMVVVTHEVPAQSARKVKIPNVCIGVGIRCLTPFEMLRAERARFILERQTGNEQLLLAETTP